MTKIKLCGLSRPCDIDYANALSPDYIGFVFAAQSKRYVTPETANALRKRLKHGIMPVGVFVDAEIPQILSLIQAGTIGAVQLHGKEDDAYLHALRQQTNVPILQAYRIRTAADIAAANCSIADFVLLDSGAGTGTCFDWALLSSIARPYFLAGGLTTENVGMAIARLQPYALDASSALEQDGYKDFGRMQAFVQSIRKEEII